MSAGAAVLVTGGTGAVGRELVRELARGAAAEIFVLTRDPDAPAARALLDVAAPHAQGEGSRPRLIRGDVREPGLGLDAAAAATLRRRTTHVMHCAGATSFTLPLHEARGINVRGTRAVLEFARSCERVRAVGCASTAYVAGRRTGVILENQPGAATEWVNSYEQSKHEMENVVREAMSDVPVSLYRFSTVIGHSVTGTVTGFNAIHHALRLFYQGLAPMMPGDLATRVDLVPVDFAARAMHHLVMRRFEPGRTYHLCAGESRSCTLDELLSQTVECFERCRPAWRKRRIARPAVVDAGTYALFVRSVEESGNVLLHRATQAVQAFAWQLAYPKTFDTRLAGAALAGGGPAGEDITPPHVATYYSRVVAYCVETSWGHAASAGGGAAA